LKNENVSQEGNLPPETYRQCYEQLRRQILTESSVTAPRWGLNLLMTRGLAAWIKAWPGERKAAVSEADQAMPDERPVIGLPESLQHQMAMILAEMILRRTPVSA
jgi:hypothetical protein